MHEFWSQCRQITRNSEQNNIKNAEYNCLRHNVNTNMHCDFACHKQSKVYQYIRSLTKSYGFPLVVFYKDSSVYDDYNKASLIHQYYFYSVFTTSNINTLENNTVLDTTIANQMHFKFLKVKFIKIFIIPLWNSVRKNDVWMPKRQDGPSHSKEPCGHTLNEWYNHTLNK